MKERRSFEGWQDTVELLIAVWLCASPFLLGYIENGAATTAALMLGVMIILVSQLGIATQTQWEEWVTILLAALLMGSPWLLSYTHLQLATINALTCGALLIVFCILAMVHDIALAKENKKIST